MKIFQLIINSHFVAFLVQVSRSEPDRQQLPNGGNNSWEPGNEVAKQQVTNEETCTDLWFTPENGSCHCGASIHKAVACNEQTKEVMILDCYCMTDDSVTNQTVVGICFYNCVNMSQKVVYKDYVFHPTPSTCSYLNRKGTLCGDCDYANNYFPRAYSYAMDCIACHTPHSWWLYVTYAFLPLTVFIAIIFVFRISVVSPKLRAFVCFAQIFAAPIQLRVLLLATRYTSPVVMAIIEILASFYGIWNLDFFRTLLPGICLHLTTLQVLALDYLIAVYPMLLMVIAYILVELHGHGFRPVLLMWKPFHYFFARFRRGWDIQTSIIDAFVTFFILSTTKLLSVSFDLLMPTTLHTATGESVSLRLFYDPNREYFKHEHFYFALLALIVLCLFILFPVCLLIFSSMHCAQNIFRSCRMRIRVVREFLHAFQQYYKDGSNGTMDCRWFAAFYILNLLGIYLQYAIIATGYLYELAIIYFIIVAITILIVEPYKREYAIYNILDCLLFLWLALTTASFTFFNFASLF